MVDLKAPSKFSAGLLINLNILTWLATASYDEYRLLNDIKQNYNPLERPVSNSSLALNVTMKIYLQQILDVDEKNQVVTLAIWIEYKWNDYKLKWDPREYGGIHDIRFPGHVGAIWKPDVLLYNSADEKFDSLYPSNYVVSNTGDVLHVPPGIVKLSCKIDITWFPFDDQMCYLKFGSWTYSGNFIDLQISSFNQSKNASMDLIYYVENGEWNLLATPAFHDRSLFGSEPYCAIYFYLLIQRRTLYYGLNLIVPSVLISLMTILGFTLPPDAGEKITLEITILLSVCFFLSMVAEMTPPTSEAVPLIGAFFSCCMMVVSANVVFTVLVLNLHHRKPETHEMSPFLGKCLLKWLPWLLMMHRPGAPLFSEKSSNELINKDGGKPSYLEALYANSVEAIDSLSLIRKLKPISSSETIPPNDSSIRIMPTSLRKAENVGHKRPSGLNPPHSHFSCDQFSGNEIDSRVREVRAELREIVNHMKAIRKRMDDEDQDEQAENDWKFAAMVIDRLCLITFTLFIVISTCAIMLSSPHLIA